MGQSGTSAARRGDPSALAVFAWSILIALLMSTEFIAQPFVWRNWPLEDVMAGWLRVAIDRCLVAGCVAGCLVIADWVRPRGQSGRTTALGLAVVAGALIGEVLRIALDPSADRTDAPAVAARMLQWVLISMAGAGILVSWRLHKDLETSTAESAAAEARSRRMMTACELEALQRQIEPHFLFNSLATIKRFGQIAPADGQALLERLFDYISSIFTVSAKGLSSLGAELDLVLAYLDVCAVRMGARLTVVDAVPPALRVLNFPPLMLGTLVENAIRHGIAPSRHGGTITLEASATSEVLEFTVTDDGVGLVGEGGCGIGLANLTARLRLLYGDGASFQLRPVTPRGFAATLRLPRAIASL